jgi:ligand-binding sensor domain-containing protein
MSDPNSATNQTENRPGLAQLTYRIADYAAFRARMLDRLSRIAVKPDPFLLAAANLSTPEDLQPLQKLTTRQSDDPAIALFDAWAAVADVLTFYQERIINEGYLRTAIERRSVIELARMIGYELSSGVAASTFLAFNVEDTPNSPRSALVPKGTPIASIPGQGELSQLFETSEDLTARVEWNALKPRTSRSQTITATTRQLYVNGISTQLQVGDPVLLVDAESPEHPHYLLFLSSVEAFPAQGFTLIKWQRSIPAFITLPPKQPQLFAFRQRANLFGQSAPEWLTLPDDVKRSNGGTIRGGVFRSINNGTNWTASSTGLPSADVLCLVTQNGILLAGTGGFGVFRSDNSGATWELSTEGITNAKIQTLYVDRIQKHLYAGTPAGGVFRSKDGGNNWVAIGTGSVRVESRGADNWQSVNTGLPNTVVRSIVTYTAKVEGTGNITGTDKEILVTGDVNTSFTTQLSIGDIITSEGQTRTVTGITEKAKITINQPFSPTISGKPYTIGGGISILVGTDTGVYRSADDGKNWTPIGLSDRAVYALTANETEVFAGTDAGIFRYSLPNNSGWSPSALSNQTVYAIVIHQQSIFAGTNAGIYQNSQLDNANWSELAQLPNRVIYALTVREGSIFAGTDAGIFRSDTNGASWMLVNQGFVSVDEHFPIVLSLITQSSGIFAGTQFAGFVETEWRNFAIASEAQLDLDTQYPKVLPDSWVVLLDNDAFHASQITAATTTTRSEFGLTSKLTQLTLNQAINAPDRFNRRTAIVLVQSEPLELTEEQLAVNVQQAEIFHDPIHQNTIFLKDFVTGLESEKTVIISGKLIQVQTENIGGIFRSLDWEKISPGLSNQAVQAIALHPNDYLFAATGGGIFATFDQGENWLPLNPNLTSARSLIITSDGYLFATADTGILRSIDNGDTWTSVYLELHHVEVRSLAIGSNQTLFAATNMGVLRSLDHGEHWMVVNQGITATNIRIRSIVVNARGTVFAIAENQLFRSTSNGDSWQVIQQAELTGMQSIAVNATTSTLFLITNTSVLRSTNEGVLWTVVSQELRDRVVQSIVINASGYLFAATDQGIWCSTNQGENWTALNRGLPDLNVRSLVVNAGGALFAATQAGVFCSINNGMVWVPINQGLINYPDIRALVRNSRGQLFAATSGGIFRSLDNSVTWETLRRGIRNSQIRTIAINSTDHLFAATLTGVLQSVDNGETWTSLDPALSDTQILAIVLTSTNELIATTCQEILRFRNNRFESVAAIETQVRSLTRNLQGILFAATESGVFRTSTRRINWIADPANVQTIAIDSEGILFAGTGSGIFRSVDQGFSWQPFEITQGLTNLNVRDLKIGTDNVLFVATPIGIFRLLKTAQSWQQSQPLNVRSLTISADGAVFAATRSGVYRSQDHGETWEQIGSSLLNVRAIAIYNFDQVFAGTVSGMFRLQLSGEESDWQEFNHDGLNRDIRALAIKQDCLFAGTVGGVFQLQLTPEILTATNPAWQAIATGLQTIQGITIGLTGTIWITSQQGIAYSTNDGETWQRFNRGLMSLDVRQMIQSLDSTLYIATAAGVMQLSSKSRKTDQLWIANLPDVRTVVTTTNTVFAATDQGVYRSLDGGRTWLVANQGLTNLEIQTIVLSANKNILFAATPAGVFQSLNNGDAWIPIQRDLPNQAVRSLGFDATENLLTATRTGIFRFVSQLEQIGWQQINSGLTNLQIQALTLDANHHLYAGTQNGVFRSIDHGQTWELTSKGLTTLNIQTLSPVGSKSLFAGTASGIFRFDHDAKQWQAVNAGLVYLNVRSIATQRYQANSDTPILFVGTLEGGVFRSDNNGDTWLPTSLAVTDVQALAVKPNSPVLFAGTLRQGIFYSDNNGFSWQPITDIRSGIGTLSSQGTTVIGKNTTFADLEPGDTINVNDQSRTVLTLDRENCQLTIDLPFRPDPLSDQSFTINTGLTSRNITAIAIAPNNTIFAGTAGSGIFRSRDQGNRWQPVNENLSDLEIRCLQITEAGHILAGTASTGVFRSLDEGDSWLPVNLNLTSTDVRSLLVVENPDSQITTLYAGGIGILKSPETFSTVELQRGDVLQLLEPPILVSQAPETYREWRVMDQKGFAGVLITAASQQITLLPAAEASIPISEAVQIETPPIDQKQPILLTQTALKYAYDPATVKIYANVVRATHGETTQEVLGSGDGTLAHQQFALQKPPLTYVPAATARGAQSTLEVRVNQVLWREVPSLYPLTMNDRAYIIRIQDDGTTTITFGDGIRGARLPSGLENVTATYRSGLGMAGNVGAVQLKLLKARPLGIQDVINPLPASGGEDQEPLETAKVKAPSTVKILDRIVSLPDFENFTRSFAGIGKAQTTALWTGSNQLVHITIAGINGSEVLPESELYLKLMAAIDSARDLSEQVQIASYQRLLFNLEARILVDPSYIAALVEQAVQQKLIEQFAFDRRDFGQPVTAAAVIATMHQIEGVIAVDLDALHRLGASRTLQPVIPVTTAFWDTQLNAAQPAQLLLINAAAIQLTSVTTL